MIVTGAQSKALQIGKYGCYFLCLLKLAEKASLLADMLFWYDEAERTGYMGEDPTMPGSRCFLFKPDEFLSRLMGRIYVLRKEGPDYVARPDELEVQRWEIPNVSGHFVLPDWDPMGTSRTKEVGKLISKRIFKEVSV